MSIQATYDRMPPSPPWHPVFIDFTCWVARRADTDQRQLFSSKINATSNRPQSVSFSHLYANGNTVQNRQKRRAQNALADTVAKDKTKYYCLLCEVTTDAVMSNQILRHNRNDVIGELI